MKTFFRVGGRAITFAAALFAQSGLAHAQTGLVAAYTFNEGSGTTVADLSGNNNTGALGAGVTWSAQGKVGGALVFDGSSFVTVLHGSSLNLTAGMTLEAWVFPTAIPVGTPKVLWKDWPNQQIAIYGIGSGASSNGPEVFFSNENGIPVGLAGSPDLPLNTWSHLAATYDAATTRLTLYVNGVIRRSSVVFAQSSAITTSTGALRIGGNNVTPGASFQGRIDEVRIYNRALSQAEIQVDMNTPVASPAPDTSPPSATTGLTAAAVSTSQINLVWNPATDNVGVIGYRVDRCQGGGCTTFAQIATSSGTGFADPGRTPGTSYGYRVRAADAAGNLGAYSNIASATVPASDTSPPTAPSGLTATAISSSQINLSWTASTDNLSVTGYRVEHCQGLGCSTFTQIATPSTTSYSTYGLSAATSYSFRVRAVDAAGNLGPYSSTASATTQAADTTAPTAPSGLTATAVNPKQIDLSWTASADNVGVSTYGLERCQGANCTNFVEIAAPVPTNYFNTFLSTGTTYRYRVRARDAAGNLSAYSNIASATTPTDTTPPTAPSALTATAVSSSQINLSWTASTDNFGVDVYEWYRCQGTSCTNFAIVSNANRTTSATDTGRAASTTYRYRVRARDVAGNLSAYSNIASATTQATDTTPPTAPSGLSAYATTSQVNLSWTASTDNLGVTGYRVDRCQGGGCTSFVQVGTSTIVSFSDAGVAVATSYRYRVRAVDAAGNLSAYSNVISITTQALDTTAPTAPTALTATAAGPTQINLTWTASTDDVGVTGYQIDRCQGVSCTDFAQSGTSAGTSFSSTGLLGSTTYRYRVRATDGAGNVSGNSNIASGTTTAPISLSVTNPLDGATIASDTVTVSGTFVGPSNTGIAVNFVVATIVGNTFVATNVPLALGANTLTATLTTLDNQTAGQTLSVTSSGPGPMEVVASPTQGVAPLNVTFTINNRTGRAIQSVQADYSGTGGFSNVNPTALTNNYSASGIYQAAFIIIDSTGASYQRTVPVAVQDTAQIDQILRTTWSGFTTALAAQDTAQASQIFNAQAREKYGPVMSALLPGLPQIVASFSTLQPVSISGGVGEYAINRTINGVNKIFFIYFVRDTDGVWRLDSM